jgi:catechol 2,3-dioxygenase-like lactoylglutathione lyase family enzyme
MAREYAYGSVSPIGDTDPMDMPVADVEKAIAWYESRMGFHLVSRRDGPAPSAVVERDGVQLGFAVNGGDPEQASCYLGVSDVQAAMADMEAKGVGVANHRIDEHGGEKREVFFVRDEDGICYCIGQRV